MKEGSLINSSINSPQQYLSHQIIISTHYENASIVRNNLFDVDNISYQK